MQIRSAKDPHVMFGILTGGSFYLGPTSSGLILAGVILLLFSFAMLGLAGYKTYRFCIKYTFKEYLRKQR